VAGSKGQEVRWKSPQPGTFKLVVLPDGGKPAPAVQLDGSGGVCPLQQPSLCAAWETLWVVKPAAVGAPLSARVLVPQALCGVGVVRQATIQVVKP
jgi:hypothetical protein